MGTSKKTVAYIHLLERRLDQISNELLIDAELTAEIILLNEDLRKASQSINRVFKRIAKGSGMKKPSTCPRSPSDGACPLCDRDQDFKCPLEGRQ